MALNLQLNPRGDYPLFRPLLPATVLLCPPGFGVLLDRLGLISFYLLSPVFANHLSLCMAYRGCAVPISLRPGRQTSVRRC